MHKNEILHEIRMKKHMTQVEFANWLEIPYKTYKAYENGLRMPRINQANKIIEKLKEFGVFSPAIFYLKQDEESDEIRGFVTKRIAKYMNIESNKNFLPVHVKTIRKSLILEKKTRSSNINSYSNKGKDLINAKAAKIANNILGIKFFTKNDIRLFKLCEDQEYEDRTGKSTWGIRNERRRLGFCEETGYEIEDE